MRKQLFIVVSLQACDGVNDADARRKRAVEEGDYVDAQIRVVSRPQSTLFTLILFRYTF